MTVAALVDTNVLVYCYDRRNQQKQRIASELVDRGIAERSICISYQSIVEFYSVVTREIRGAGPLLDKASAAHETEDLLMALDVLYPTELIVRTALRATATYQLSWWDAQIFAYAEVNGLTEIISEDFHHGRRYGSVTVVNPFQ